MGEPTPVLGRAEPETTGPSEAARGSDRSAHDNETLAKDFGHEQSVTGRKFRVLTIVDTCLRLPPATDPRFGDSGEDVLHTLARNCIEIGDPRAICIDEGAEFISRDLDLCAN